MSISHKISLAAGTHPKSDKLTGKRVWYHYKSGVTLEHYYKDADTIIWTGVKGAFTGHHQEEKLYAFEIAPDIFYINWCEEATIATVKQNTMWKGSYPVAIVADFTRLVATAVYINPNEEGGDDYIIDQARLEIRV